MVIKVMVADDQALIRESLKIILSAHSDIEVVATVEDGMVTIRMAIGVYPEGTMKPGDMWKLGKEQYGWPVTDSYSIHREAILIETDGACITPLEVE